MQGDAVGAFSDVLVIGAGSAGSVVAERLSRDESCRVTVVESGPAPSDPRVRAQITNAVRMPIGAASSVVRHYTAKLTDHPVRHGHVMRGAVVGGSGAVNGGYFCRALPEDFERWSLPGWSWDDVLPHFLAIESDLDFDGPLHGSAGPILVRRVSEFDGCTASFVDAATEMGYPWVADLNGAEPGKPPEHGIGAVPLNINGGIRIGPGGAFLQPALDRPNLTLVADTRVIRIRIDGGRATGVECGGTDGHLLLAADRVVLCAGAIGSAQLLMLSGIGPEDVLTAAGIPVSVELPVGARTSDHPEWVVPVGWTPTHDLPPVEAILTTPNGLEIRPYTRGFGAMVDGAAPDPADRPHIGVALMHPRSRGRLRVVSTDPDAAPVIEQRYDTDPHDVAALSAGAELARELASTTTTVGRATWSTSQHLCGSAPMGSDGDADAVVDERCAVRGVDGLWVIDGSVLPTVTGRGPHATIVMLGHRAADFVVA
ncbi:mycofactocin system GMC family oxidoreductase MftG [Mycolicibacterium agri]|uniref:Glucose-methanol-choline oxidoreductase n=1 Tax=Mycolicibacterium agri TaxID=36811 RepID=A0A2A7MZP9_MYCAG|nr:mycofactocin system GMC family oxidoreductase MftG [Mycolicibacterium agri]PEG37040.1 mycofactocin system GMC family oxidoreductase MftG [Mycolicibacterium agri]GFG52128.1 glucose-methanol-choline oxidoreductase [Mycolicibacterium agri]